MSQIELQSSEDTVAPPQKQKMSWWKKVLIVVAIILPVGGLIWYSVPTITKIGILIATPFILTQEEPHDERYKEIDLVLEKLDYESLGKVISVEDDGHSDVLSPATVSVVIESDLKGFNTLKDKILMLSLDELSKIPECEIADESIVCRGEFGVSSRIEKNKIFLSITDI